MRTAFDLSFQEWEPRLFIRLGSHSLLLDLQEGVFEVDGRPLRWFGRSSGHLNPLDGLGEATPLEAPVEPPLMAMADAIGRFVRETPTSAVGLSMKLLRFISVVGVALAFALTYLGSYWWTWSLSWELRSWVIGLIFIAAGLVLQALAARVRGLSAIAYAGLWWLGFASLGHPWVGALTFPFIFAAGFSRFLNPWVGPVVVLLFTGLGQGVVVLILLPWLAMAGVLTVQEFRRTDRLLPLPARAGMGDLARGSEALSHARIWMQVMEGGPLTDAFMLRADGIALPGGLPLWFLEGGADTLTFLPGALLWVREGYKAKLVPWEAVRLQSQPCVWQNPPESVELSPEQWMLRIRIPGVAPWTFIIGDAIWGQRCSNHWSRVLPTEGSTGNATEPPAVRTQDPGLLEAYRTLGLAPDASPGQVRKAYHQLAKIHHPDAHPGASPEARLEFEERMQTINEAYGCLREAGAA